MKYQVVFYVDADTGNLPELAEDPRTVLEEWLEGLVYDSPEMVLQDLNGKDWEIGLTFGGITVRNAE